MDQYYVKEVTSAGVVRQGKSAGLSLDLSKSEIFLENAADKIGTNLSLEISSGEIQSSGNFDLYIYPVIRFRVEDYVDMEVVDVVPIHLSFPTNTKTGQVNGRRLIEQRG